MADYCNTCFSLFKILDSCPRSSVFKDGNSLEDTLEGIWVASSVLLVIIYIAIGLWTFVRRTSRAFFLLLILILQIILNEVILKRIFAQARPIGACATSYGLPSGHSAFAACLATWLLLEFIMFHDKVPFKKTKVYLFLRNISILIIPLIPISRYYLNYHTIEQICFGILSGCVFPTVLFFIKISIIHRDDGKFYSNTVVKALKKLKLKKKKK